MIDFHGTLKSELHWCQFWLFFAGILGTLASLYFMVLVWSKIKSWHCMFVLFTTLAVSFSYILIAIFNFKFYNPDAATHYDVRTYNAWVLTFIQLMIFSMWNDFMTAWKYLKTAMLLFTPRHQYTLIIFTALVSLSFAVFSISIFVWELHYVLTSTAEEQEKFVLNPQDHAFYRACCCQFWVYLIY